MIYKLPTRRGRVEGYISITLYPNPNNGRMLLNYSLKPNDKATLFIYDIAGKWISTYPLNSSVTQMSINDELLNNGIYFYQIRVNGRMIQSNKLVIIK